ncbi:hypothetical protein [Haloterrigena salinisoli]|uniref:hypothetical protein n=1 Tax=Haloterrigena salinisoli TaxID=3132747 RepID=UPI0030D0F5B2
MCATFSDDDVGKPVERADGKVIGTVDAIEGDRARVEPAPDALDSIMARFGWDDIVDEPFILEADAVDAVSDTRIHLTEGFSPQESGTEAAGDRTESRDSPQNRPDH